MTTFKQLNTQLPVDVLTEFDKCLLEVYGKVNGARGLGLERAIRCWLLVMDLEASGNREAKKIHTAVKMAETERWRPAKKEG